MIMLLLMKPMSDIQEQLERVFSDLTEDFGYPATLRSGWPFRLSRFQEKTWMPAIEVSETEKEYRIKAEVPGINPEDLVVDVLGNLVTIQGESRQEKKEDKQNLHRSEFRYGQFYRQIPLPHDVQREGCRAEFKHGILMLTLPKLETTERKRLKINVIPAK